MSPPAQVVTKPGVEVRQRNPTPLPRLVIPVVDVQQDVETPRFRRTEPEPQRRLQQLAALAKAAQEK
jgi:hypothetical protein